jgi:hypothetical protein
MFPAHETRTVSHAPGSRPMKFVRSLPAVLSACILGVALYTVGFTARMVYRAYSPVIYWDQWHYVTVAMRSQGWPSWPLLWKQFDESRLVTGRLAGFADLHFFGGRNLSLQLELVLIPICLGGILIWMIRRDGGLRGRAFASAAGFIVFCALSPVQVDDFFWYFEVGFVFTGLAAVGSFAALTLHASGQRRWMSGPLLISLCAAFLAECSRFDGLLVWPILLLLALALRLPRRNCAVIGIAAALAVGVYFWNYHPPHQSSGEVWRALHHPLALVNYVVTYFAATWNALLAPHFAGAVLAKILTVFALLAAVAATLRCLYSGQRNRLLTRAALIAVLLFTISVAFMTAAARVSFGVGQAAGSRYQCVALLFWATLAALVLDWAAGRLIWVQAILLVLMLASVGRFPSYERVAESRRIRLNAAYLALTRDPHNEAAAVALNPTASLMPAWYSYLRSQNLGPTPAELDAQLPVNSTPRPIPGWAGYHPAPADRCTGWMDGFEAGIHSPGVSVLTGWAWDRQARAAPRKILLATADGWVVGLGEMSIPREDVTGAVAEVIDINTGWEGAVSVPKGTRLRAYAVLNDGQWICPLPNDVPTP